MRISTSATAALLTFSVAWSAVPSNVYATDAFVSDDAGTADKQGYEINVLNTYTHLSGETGGSLIGIEVHYGVSDRLEVQVAAPLAFDKVSGGPVTVGSGDLNIGFKYRVVDAGDDKWPVSIAVAPTLGLPTGAASHRLGTGSVHAFLPVWASKQVGAWGLFGGGGIDINPGPGNRNWMLAGFGVTYDLSERWTLGGEVYFTSAAADGQKGGLAFNLGGAYLVSKGIHLTFAVGRNLTNAAAVNAFSSVVGLQLTI